MRDVRDARDGAGPAGGPGRLGTVIPPRGVARSGSPARRRAAGVVAWSVVASVALAGCGDLVGSAPLPPGTQGPTTYNTPEGALGFYRGVKQFLANGVSTRTGAIGAATTPLLVGGALTDELAWWDRGTSPLSLGATGEPVDERLLPESPTTSPAGVEGTYNYLQGLRGRALQGIGLLRTYAPEASPALAGELQALEGYAEVLLGELFCSGVPLSTLDFEADFTYKPGATTEEVWRHAAALLDSAAAGSVDSARVGWLAKVVRGRALLDLGDYAAAAQAVASVPDTFQYTVPVAWPPAGSGVVTFFNYTVGDGEGGTGLPYASSGDPRAAVTAAGPNRFGLPLYLPDKYLLGSTAPVMLASGVEARLIEAEAALHGVASSRGSWLAILNALRALCGTAAGAGAGCATPLPALADPGASLSGPAAIDARVDLVFRERAYWLFLTGHRAGDLRRLVRNYQRAPGAVYPRGAYYGGQGLYGADVTLPIPSTEQTNPLFRGCLGRQA